MRTRSDSPTKICTVDGCKRPLRARGMCSTHYNREYQPNRHAARPTPCVVCGTVVARGTASNRRHVCSLECRSSLSGTSGGGGSYNWTSDAMVRARRLGAVVIEPVARDDVFSRDGHRCQICGERVNEPTPFDPQSATVDHIIPLSMGGEHSMRNVQTACLRCNSAKQDRMDSGPDMRRHERPPTPGEAPATYK